MVLSILAFSRVFSRVSENFWCFGPKFHVDFAANLCQCVSSTVPPLANFRFPFLFRLYLPYLSVCPSFQPDTSSSHIIGFIDVRDLLLLFRCVLASLYKGASVGPPVGLFVCHTQVKFLFIAMNLNKEPSSISQSETNTRSRAYRQIASDV